METVARGERTGLAPGTIKTRFNNVRSVLRGAVQDRVIPTDPSAGVRLPRGRRAQAAMTLPTAEEVGRLLEEVAPAFRAFVELCAFAGLRLGEAAAAQVGDVDLGNNSLRVARQVQRANGGTVELRPPKYGSERTIYLPEALTDTLAKHIAILGTAHDPCSWLFEGENGHPLHQNSVGYWWRKTRRAAACPNLRLHDLRHYFASGLIAAAATWSPCNERSGTRAQLSP